MEPFGPVIYAYTASNALDDGLYVDGQDPELGLADVSRQHYAVPLYLTQGLADYIRHAVEHCGRDWPGVWHDILTISRNRYKAPDPMVREFTVLIADTPTTHTAVDVRAVCQPFDTADHKAVIVFCLPEED